MNQQHGSRGISRRELVGGALGAGMTLALGARAARAEDDTEPAGGHWSYVGDDGPDYWGNLDPEFAACSLGNQQSPINFPMEGNAENPDLELPKGSFTTENIFNNGHTIQVSIAPGVTMSSGGTEFTLKQIHMHAPSEHRVDGIIYPMELHYVFASEAGNLAALGVFLKEGQENPAYAPIFAALPKEKGPDQPLVAEVPFAGAFPEDKHSFSYVGSLTTPPCTEGLLWEVFLEPVSISVEQMAEYLAIFPFNARPVQENENVG